MGTLLFLFWGKNPPYDNLPGENIAQLEICFKSSLPTRPHFLFSSKKVPLKVPLKAPLKAPYGASGGSLSFEMWNIRFCTGPWK
ncbi:MAG: hypothetical protein LBF40_10560, partial [Deltaproteobacteria bacterium]|nr:hypothetical protein [Deltaproteobacteria bacterium]